MVWGTVAAITTAHAAFVYHRAAIGHPVAKITQAAIATTDTTVIHHAAAPADPRAIDDCVAPADSGAIEGETGVQTRLGIAGVVARVIVAGDVGADVTSRSGAEQLVVTQDGGDHLNDVQDVERLVRIHITTGSCRRGSGDDAERKGQNQDGRCLHGMLLAGGSREMAVWRRFECSCGRSISCHPVGDNDELRPDLGRWQCGDFVTPADDTQV